MTVAVIGTGAVGSALTRNLASGGVDLLVSGLNLPRATALAASLDGRARAVPVAEAIASADVVVLAVPFDAARLLVVEHGHGLTGTIVVDPSNPVVADRDGLRRTVADDRSSGEILADLLPADAPLVKAFGTFSADDLAALGRRDEPIVAFYAADDEFAGERVADLIRAAGFDPVRVGGLDQAARIEVFGDLHQTGGLGGVVTRAEALAAL